MPWFFIFIIGYIMFMPVLLGARITFSPLSSLMDYLKENHSKKIAASVVSFIVGILIVNYIDAKIEFSFELQGFSVFSFIFEKLLKFVSFDKYLTVNNFFIAIINILTLGGKFQLGIILMPIIPFLLGYMALGVIAAIIRAIFISINVFKLALVNEKFFILKAFLISASTAAVDIYFSDTVNISYPLAGSIGFFIYVIFMILIDD